MTWDVLANQISGYAPNVAKELRNNNKDLIQKLCEHFELENCSPDELYKMLNTVEGISKLTNFEFSNFYNGLPDPVDYDPCSHICLDEKYFNVQVVLATFATIAFFAIVGYVIAFGMANLTKEGAFIVGNLTGIAGAIAKDVYGYFFGSSIGSKQKSKTIEQQKMIIK